MFKALKINYLNDISFFLLRLIIPLQSSSINLHYQIFQLLQFLFHYCKQIEKNIIVCCHVQLFSIYQRFIQNEYHLRKFTYELAFEINCIQQHTTFYRMAFQVREFEFDADDEEFVWKFKLGNINSSQLDFYSLDLSNRSLLHLAQDFNTQIEQCLEKKYKKGEQKDRMIRKLCEKMIKNLSINITSFAQDIEESKEEVLAYFSKKQQQEGVRQRIMQKCKKWIIATWDSQFFIEYYNKELWILLLTFLPSFFYQTTNKYLQSFIKDGKKINPDFDLLNELYVITLGDRFKQKEDEPKQFSDTLILIDINLNIDEKYITDSFLWDSQNISNIKIKSFAYHFLKDTLAENNVSLQKQQFQQLQKQTRTQLRTQILYKTLLKKYAFILLNFSSIDIPSEAKEYLIPITLKITSTDGSTIFQDKFQWDILNESNNIEEFVDGLIQDYDIPKKYFSQLCFKIRTQINSELEWKFDLLVKTFKSIHKDRQSPKLNTQTISVLRKNITYAMDVNLPCTDQKEKLNFDIYFNNSDLFSLLSRNIDILPEEFQEILMCKQGKNQEKEANKLSKEQSNQIMKKMNLTIENNPYIPNLGNTHNLHTIWRKNINK